MDQMINLRLILSTPTATPMEVSPDWIAWAIVLIAINPEEHNRLTVEIGTS